MINKAIEGLVRERFGEAAWAEISLRAGADAEVFLSNEPYPDAITYRLIEAASEVLEIPAPVIIESFGEYWVLGIAKVSYGHLLTGTGSSLPEFLQNLDAMHARVALIYPKLRPPTFRCSEVTARTLRLHYHSERQGFAPFVLGLVRGLGTMFGTPATITQLCSAGEGADHDEFLVAIEGG